MTNSATMKDTHHASCVCGAVQVRCSGLPRKVSLCHCPACQKRTGVPFGIAAFYPVDDVQIAGTTRAHTRPSDSGHTVTSHFCPACGSTVFWYPARMPDLVAVAPGAFADPDFPAPSQEVYTQCRHAWVKPLES